MVDYNRNIRYMGCVILYLVKKNYFYDKKLRVPASRKRVFTGMCQLFSNIRQDLMEEKIDLLSVVAS